ncbi:hypothetical protein ACTFIZ_004967 [Dictyostelium cf. discoideum]
MISLIKNNKKRDFKIRTTYTSTSNNKIYSNKRYFYEKNEYIYYRSSFGPNKISLIDFELKRKKTKQGDQAIEELVKYTKSTCAKEDCNGLNNVPGGYCYHHSIPLKYSDCATSLKPPPSHTYILKCKKCITPEYTCVEFHSNDIYHELVDIKDACFQYLYGNYRCIFSSKDCKIKHLDFSNIISKNKKDQCQYRAFNIGTFEPCNRDRPCKLHPLFNKYSYKFQDGQFYKDPRLIQLKLMKDQENTEILESSGIDGDTLISFGFISVSAENLFKIKQESLEAFNLITNYSNIPNNFKKGLKFGKVINIEKVYVREDDIITIKSLDTSSITVTFGQEILMVKKIQFTDEQIKNQKIKLYDPPIKNCYFNKKAFNITPNGENFVSRYAMPPEFNPFNCKDDPIPVLQKMKEYSRYMLFGYIVGDGCVSKSEEISISIYNGDLQLFKNVWSFLSKNENNDFTISKSNNPNILDFKIKKEYSKSYFLNYFNDTIKGSRINQLEKFPSRVISTQLIYKMAFFRGLYSADGSTHYLFHSGPTLDPVSGPTKSKTETVDNDPKYTYLYDLKKLVTQDFGISFKKDGVKKSNTGGFNKISRQLRIEGSIENEINFKTYIGFSLCAHKLIRQNIGLGFKLLNNGKTHYDEYNIYEYLNQCGNARGAFSEEHKKEGNNKVTYGNNISSWSNEITQVYCINNNNDNREKKKNKILYKITLSKDSGDFFIANGFAIKHYKK